MGVFLLLGGFGFIVVIIIYTIIQAMISSKGNESAWAISATILSALSTMLLYETELSILAGMIGFIFFYTYIVHMIFYKKDIEKTEQQVFQSEQIIQTIDNKQEIEIQKKEQEIIIQEEKSVFQGCMEMILLIIGVFIIIMAMLLMILQGIVNYMFF